MEKLLALLILLFYLPIFLCCSSPKLPELGDETPEMISNPLIPDKKTRERLIDMIISHTKSSDCPLVVSETVPVGNQKNDNYRDKTYLKKDLEKRSEDKAAIQDEFFNAMYTANTTPHKIAKIRTCRKDGYFFTDNNVYRLYINGKWQGEKIYRTGRI